MYEDSAEYSERKKIPIISFFIQLNTSTVKTTEFVAT